MTIRSSGMWCVAVSVLAAVLLKEPVPADQAAGGKDAPAEFECRWADGPVTLDGKADEPAWKAAQLIDHFYLPWLGKNARPARTATKARLLPRLPRLEKPLPRMHQRPTRRRTPTHRPLPSRSDP